MKYGDVLRDPTDNEIVMFVGFLADMKGYELAYALVLANPATREVGEMAGRDMVNIKWEQVDDAE